MKVRKASLLVLILNNSELLSADYLKLKSELNTIFSYGH